MSQQKTLDDKLFFKLDSQKNQNANIFIGETSLIQRTNIGLTQEQTTVLEVNEIERYDKIESFYDYDERTF